jgi:hypothetical protein
MPQGLLEFLRKSHFAIGSEIQKQQAHPKTQPSSAALCVSLRSLR